MDFLSDNGGIDYNNCYCKSFPSQPSRPADHRMVQTVFNNFEIADMNLWRGEAYTAFFDYLDRSGGFYYEVCLLTAALQCEQDRFPTEYLICGVDSAGVTHPCTRSPPRSSRARTKSTSSRRWDTNITRSPIAPRAKCGSAVGVLASRKEILVRCARERPAMGLLARSRACRSCSFLYRLPHRVVVLAEVGSGEGHPSPTVTTRTSRVRSNF